MFSRKTVLKVISNLYDEIKLLQICKAAARLHNFMIEQEETTFMKRLFDATDFKVDVIASSPQQNWGYYIDFLTQAETQKLPQRQREDTQGGCRQRILVSPESCGLLQPNIDAVLDANTVYTNESQHRHV